ncbi:hypothetical protein [Rhodohalobacter mucosus]|uniref:Outer membrane protein beta-barrel domain-containing protein n=1 Tax=Rhodohalobacter mucosus TaxID=2079485 RepID=A0A316TQ37_9BACT|nr:hypothetical protein [Rhodohalobacter mucosus]PWN05125.1 hypothetical protein DDZ15_16355 [Rhodohalobacter mucosus]
MKRLISVFAFFLLCSGFITEKSFAQSPKIQLAGGNVLNGTLTGTILGAATMALNNDKDISPLRIGIGSGVLGGFAIALYDVATLPAGQEFFISGVFNDGRNSTVIILLDTFYGAAGGAILGSAVTLISNSPVVEGLRLGSGIGAWTGFGFGLIDSFVLAEKNRDFMASALLNRSSLFQINTGTTEIGIAQPTLHQQTVISPNALSMNIEPVINVISLRTSF